MRLYQLIEELEIFAKYGGNPICEAKNDCLFVDSTDRPISEEDLTSLYKLGWLQVDALNKYDPTDMWYSWL